MSLRWSDVHEIAIELTDSHPAVDPRFINFVDLMRWVIELEGFEEDRKSVV